MRERTLVIVYETLDDLERKLEAELEIVREKLGKGAEAIVGDILRDIEAHPCEYLRSYRWPVAGGHLFVPEDWLTKQAGVPVGKAVRGKYKVVEQDGGWWVVLPQPLPKDCLEELRVFLEALKVAREHGKVAPVKGVPHVIVEARVVRRHVDVNPRKLTKTLAKWGVKKRQVMMNWVRKYYYVFPLYLF